jgi:hypothetical protein
MKSLFLVLQPSPVADTWYRLRGAIDGIVADRAIALKTKVEPGSGDKEPTFITDKDVTIIVPNIDTPETFSESLRLCASGLPTSPLRSSSSPSRATWSASRVLSLPVLPLEQISPMSASTPSTLPASAARRLLESPLPMAASSV